jgi:hypothetical protein
MEDFELMEDYDALVRRVKDLESAVSSLTKCTESLARIIDRDKNDINKLTDLLKRVINLNLKK